MYTFNFFHTRICWRKCLSKCKRYIYTYLVADIYNTEYITGIGKTCLSSSRPCDNGHISNSYNNDDNDDNKQV